MEKIPKLLGARFTTRNGAIVILRRNSRQAEQPGHEAHHAQRSEPIRQNEAIFIAQITASF
jgi:hypothetical protein